MSGTDSLGSSSSTPSSAAAPSAFTAAARTSSRVRRLDGLRRSHRLAHLRLLSTATACAPAAAPAAAAAFALELRNHPAAFVQLIDARHHHCIAGIQTGTDFREI